MGCFSPDPVTIDPGESTAQALKAQVDNAPGIYAAEAKFRPQYTELELQELNRTLMGTDSSPGILSQLEENILPSYQRGASNAAHIQRAADLADVQEFGSQYTQAFREMDPEQARLIDSLTSQAQGELDDGGLSAHERHRMQQGFRQASRGRLGNTGTAGASAEAFYLADRERDRTNQNRSFAAGVSGLRQASYGDPLMSVLGRPSGSTPYAGGILGQGQGISQGAGQQLFNPQEYGMQVSQYNANAQNAANIAGANSMAGIVGGGLGAIGGIGGGLLSNEGLFGK